MKKQYERVAFTAILLESEDIVRTSGINPEEGRNDDITKDDFSD